MSRKKASSIWIARWCHLPTWWLIKGFFFSCTPLPKWTIVNVLQRAATLKYQAFFGGGWKKAEESERDRKVNLSLQLLLDERLVFTHDVSIAAHQMIICWNEWAIAGMTTLIAGSTSNARLFNGVCSFARSLTMSHFPSLKGKHLPSCQSLLHSPQNWIPPAMIALVWEASMWGLEWPSPRDSRGSWIPGAPDNMVEAWKPLSSLSVRNPKRARPA